MAKRKMTKGQTMIYKTLHRKLKDWATGTPLKPAVNSDAPIFSNKMNWVKHYYTILMYFIFMLT